MNRHVFSPPASSGPSQSFVSSDTDRSSSEEPCQPIQNFGTALQGHSPIPFQPDGLELRYEHSIPPSNRLDFTKNVNRYSYGVLMGRVDKHTRPATFSAATTLISTHTPGASHKSRLWPPSLFRDPFDFPVAGHVRESPATGIDMLIAAARIIRLSEISCEIASSGAPASSQAPPADILPRPSTLRSSRHMTLATVSDADQRKRPFACGQCPSRFKEKSHLRQHVRSVHEKLRPHACQYDGCDSSFTTRFSRDQHMWTVHERMKPFCCPYPGCDARFGQSSHMYRHYKRHSHCAGAGPSRAN